MDMHVHTEFSYDSFSKIKKIAKRAREKKFGIAITDHNEIKGAQEAMKRFKDILIIPGIEVRSHSGVDILIYFYDLETLETFYENHVKPFRKNNPFVTDLSEEEIVNRARLFKCVISAAHPFAPRKLGLAGVIKTGTVSKNILKKIDLVEIKNGVMMKLHNFLSKKWARKINKSFSAGSDAHFSGQAGSILTLVKLQEGQHFLDAVKSQKAKVVGNEEILFRSVLLFIATELKLLFNRKGFRMFLENMMNSITLARRERNNFFRKIFDALKEKSSSSFPVGRYPSRKNKIIEKIQEKILKELIIEEKFKILSCGFSRKLISKYASRIDEKIQKNKNKYDMILSEIPKKIRLEKRMKLLTHKLKGNGRIVFSTSSGEASGKLKKLLKKLCLRFKMQLETKKVHLEEMSASFLFFVISKKI